MDERRSGAVLMAIGLAVAATGLVGLAVASDPSAPADTTPAGPTATVTADVPTSSVAPPPATAVQSTAPTAAAAPTVTTVAAPTPTNTPDAEAQIRAFYVQFVPAYRAGDADTLLALLHPASLERYGPAACRTSFSRSKDATYAVVVKAVDPPEPWAYARDGLSTTIADAVAIEVGLTSANGTADAVFHLAPVDGRFRWFADCGTPLGASPAP